MELQNLVDQLAADIHRAIVVSDTEYVPLATSFDIGDSARRGGLERMIVPVRTGTALLGFLWVVTHDLPKLSSLDLRLIDSAAALAVPLLAAIAHRGSDPRPNTSGHPRSLAGLLDGSRRERESVFTDAVGRRVIERGIHTVVYAALTDASASPLRVEALCRREVHGAASRLHFVTRRDQTLFFVGIEPRSQGEFTARIREMAAGEGVTLTGIGSARFDGMSDDLEPTAGRAERAASLSSALPEFRGGARFEELGGWHLIAGAGAGGMPLETISPAAAYLVAHADPVHRETIEAFLDAGGVARAACERLRIHRTTFYYRIDNMHEVVKEALADGWQRTALHMALNLARLQEGAAGAREESARLSVVGR